MVNQPILDFITLCENSTTNVIYISFIVGKRNKTDDVFEFINLYLNRGSPLVDKIRTIQQGIDMLVVFDYSDIMFVHPDTKQFIEIPDNLKAYK